MVVWNRALRPERSQAGEWVVFSFDEPVTVTADILSLVDQVADAVEQGGRKVAIELGRNSYLGSSAIAVIVRCMEAVTEKGGSLALLGANEQTRDFVGVFDPLGQIRMAATVGELNE